MLTNKSHLQRFKLNIHNQQRPSAQPRHDVHCAQWVQPDASSIVSAQAVALYSGPSSHAVSHEAHQGQERPLKALVRTSSSHFFVSSSVIDSGRIHSSWPFFIAQHLFSFVNMTSSVLVVGRSCATSVLVTSLHTGVHSHRQAPHNRTCRPG